MAKRIAATRGEQPAPMDPNPLERLRHCWVIDEHGRRPALLEWRQGERGWEARAVVPMLVADVWVTREEWLPAAQLDQV
jgi:hypothetical protein